MEQRVTNWEAPHQKRPLSNFFELLHDPTKIQFILSCQLQQHAWFPPYRYVILQYLTQCKYIIHPSVPKMMAWWHGIQLRPRTALIFNPFTSTWSALVAGGYFINLVLWHMPTMTQLASIRGSSISVDTSFGSCSRWRRSTPMGLKKSRTQHCSIYSSLTRCLLRTLLDLFQRISVHHFLLRHMWIYTWLWLSQEVSCMYSFLIVSHWTNMINFVASCPQKLHTLCTPRQPHSHGEATSIAMTQCTTQSMPAGLTRKTGASLPMSTMSIHSTLYVSWCLLSHWHNVVSYSSLGLHLIIIDCCNASQQFTRRHLQVSSYRSWTQRHMSQCGSLGHPRSSRWHSR